MSERVIPDQTLATNMRKTLMTLCDVVDGWQKKCADLQAKLEEQGRELRNEEQEHERTIIHRDAAEESLSLAYLTVTRNEAVWSNLFGYDEAVNDIAAELQRLRTENAEKDRIIAALKLRVEQRDKQIAVFNRNGFSDADALAEKYLDLEIENAVLKKHLNHVWEVASGDSQVAMDDTQGMEYLSDYVSAIEAMQDYPQEAQKGASNG